MASISKDPGGRRRILFVAPDGLRKPIRLGKVTQKTAETIKLHVEHLASSAASGCAVELQTARWVSEIGSDLADKLAAVGLIAKRNAPKNETLETFLNAYVDGRTDIKPRTTINLKHAAQALVGFFGADKPLADVTPGAADDFRVFLTGKLALGENTARRILGRSKQFFRAAVRKRLIPDSPFVDMKNCTVRANAERFHVVGQADAVKIMDACPDSQWRLIFALCRWAGMRCPSEHLGLRWGDVDWANNRMLVRSPKTAHHEGKESRVVPLFPELRPHLEAAFDEAEPGTEFVITRTRNGNVNWRTQFERILTRAGIKAWPKLFQNLRSTRETELAEEFPLHVVTAWLGNSAPVAMKHYLQVTDEHFARAAAVEKAAQNQAQSASEIDGNEPQPVGTGNEQSPVFPGFATPCDYVPNVQVPPRGVEPRFSD